MASNKKIVVIDLTTDEHSYDDEGFEGNTNQIPSNFPGNSQALDLSKEYCATNAITFAQTSKTIGM